MSDFNVVLRGGFEGSWDGVGLARVDGDALRIGGREGRELVIPAERVERIRFASFPGTSTTRASWETRLWLQGGGKPLLILATPETAARYGPIMRAFAERVAERGGLDRIMRGPGLGTAIANFALAGCSVMAVAILFVVYAIFDGTWWMWLIAAVSLLVAGLLVVSLVRKQWPRRISSLDELADVLPDR